MADRRAIVGDRPPAFPSKARLAAELDISESTVDEWVRRGFLPKPIRCGGVVRWIWEDVVAKLKAQSSGSADPFMQGVDRV